MTGLDIIIFAAVKAFILSPDKVFYFLLGLSSIACPILDKKAKERAKK